MIDHKRLCEVLDYDHLTGIFIWKIRISYNTRPGHVAGCVGSRGYVRISIDHKEYQAHRLAWLFMTGEWPIDHIDHVNLCRNDNRFSNLRTATISQNAANQPSKKNTSGAKGVVWNKRCGKWQAQIKVHGKSHYLGLFEDFEAARSARLKAASEYFGEYAREEAA